MPRKKYLLLAALVMGCTSTTPNAVTPSATALSSRSLVGADPWTLTIADDECTLRGSGGAATLGACRGLGELRLEGLPAAADLGAKIQAMTIEREEAAGGVRAVLTTTGAQYLVPYVEWSAVERQLRGLLRDQRVAQREKTFENLPACPAGQVVLTYDGCPGAPGAPGPDPSDACGPPVHTCGAPLGDGAACTHNAACASGACSLEGTCQGHTR